MGSTSSWTPSSTPDTIQYSQAQPLQPFPCPPISWYCQVKPLNKRWLDRSQTALCGLVLPLSNCHYHLKVLWTLTSTTTTHAANPCPVSPSTTNNQMIKSGRRMMTVNLFNTGQRLWRRKNLCQGQLNLDGGIVTFLPYYTLTLLLFSHHYLIPLLQGHMVMHVITLWLTSFFISDSFPLSMTHNSYY